MNNEFLDERTFLFPYYKQFMKLLKNNKILFLGNKNPNEIKFFEEFNIIVFENIADELVDGVIINNYLSVIDKKDLNTELDKINNSLKEGGIILLINNKKLVDEETIKYLFKEKCEEVEELIGDDKWNFVLYQKRTTK